MVEGLLVVDKPTGLTSHDVVRRVRRLAATRRVGHAGTLDPMASGVLLVGVGRATRLLGHLALADKSYTATIRLGQATTTDDADGELVAPPAGGAGRVRAAELPRDAVAAAVHALTGDLDQVPSSVSAIKVEGKRAYARVRAGEDVDLRSRRVRVDRFEILDRRAVGDLLDVDVAVTCSTGTYVRALARDLGEALRVGGHLTALRRTRVGRFGEAGARSLAQLGEEFEPLPLSEVVAACFPRLDLDLDLAQALRHGIPPPAAGLGPGPVGAFGPDGEVIALVQERGGLARPLAVFAT